MSVMVSAVVLFAIGSALLVGCAGFLFLATLHRAGSDGWNTAVLSVLTLGIAGAFLVGCASRLALFTTARSEIELDDDAMWLG